ncbi:shikimate kinase [Dermatobacter hominis]|uniref:shikimate kinase n=1 Tax=Dermatobacter hominis TaxID=2884263 RepID=UPI001D0F6080|nr:shikimate kinase [Dermatobacter hominis]UDY36184.1 shikimate kinase [Dermatobacter hominis]
MTGRPGPRRHLALIGLSGTGKSTIAPLLARQLGRTAADVDRLVEARCGGATVAEVFADRGEPGFRAVESEVLAEVLAGPDAVVATGGGVVLDPANRDLLARTATVVWLRADVDALVDRLARTAEERPLLAGDPGTTLRRLAAEREPLYDEVADLVVDATGLRPQQVVDQIERDLRAGGTEDDPR